MLVFKNANVYLNGSFEKTNIAVLDGKIVSIGDFLFSNDEDTVYDFNGLFIFPGFIDVHTHLREPGFSYKETIKTGTMAAAAGGYTTVFSMPNLNPVPDTMENLKIQTDIIKKDAVINCYPYASITIGENGTALSDIKNLSKVAVAFSDDGKGIQNKDMMMVAMKEIAETNKILAAHCEDEALRNGGVIHDGIFADINGFKGICSKSEWFPIKRDLELAKETNIKYHICHVSAKESVQEIRLAKTENENITCETAPHYLVLDESILEDDGRFKMNPPLRSAADRMALIEGIKDGTIDMIATDHAPHSIEEKSKGLNGSLMGITGLETAFPILYTYLVKHDLISLEKLITLMHDNPKRVFGKGSDIKLGEVADFTVFDLNNSFKIDKNEFYSMGKSTPFENMTVFGRCLLTVCNGKIVYERNKK